jgi:xanthosine utilization system XapX-like protein
MERKAQVWEALAKFFMTMSHGLMLAGIVAAFVEEKNCVAGIAAVLLGLMTMLLGLRVTNVSANLKEQEEWQ